jgi:hypothetical protein
VEAGRVTVFPSWAGMSQDPPDPVPPRCNCMKCALSDKKWESDSPHHHHVGLCSRRVTPAMRASSRNDRDQCDVCRANYKVATRDASRYSKFFAEQARVERFHDDLLTGGGTTIDECAYKTDTDTMDAVCLWIMDEYHHKEYTGGWMACPMDDKAESALNKGNPLLYQAWMCVKRRLSHNDHIEMQLGRRYLGKNVMRRSYVFIWSMVGGKLQQLHGDTPFNSKLISLIAFMEWNRVTRVLTAGDSDLQYAIDYRHCATPDVSHDATDAGNRAATLACYKPLLVNDATGARVREIEAYSRPVQRGDGSHRSRGGVYAKLGASVVMPSAVQHQGDASGAKGWVLSIICAQNTPGLQQDTQCFKLVIMQTIHGARSPQAVDAYYEWWHALYYSPDKAVRDRCYDINLQDHLSKEDEEFFNEQCKLLLKARELAGN